MLPVMRIVEGSSYGYSGRGGELHGELHIETRTLQQTLTTMSRRSPQGEITSSAES